MEVCGMIFKSSMFAVLRIGVVATALLVFGGCAQEREVTPLGPRTAQWLGPERKVLMAWGGVREGDPLQVAVRDILTKKGLTPVDSDWPLHFTVVASKDNRTRADFERSPWRTADFVGRKREFIGDDQRCFILVNGSADRIASISIDYQWNYKDLNLDILTDCINFGFEP
jgi:hypothetical protein